MTEIGTALAAAQTADVLLKQLKEIEQQLKPFKPDVKSFRIDYINKNSEVKFLLYVPEGYRRRLSGKVEIPLPTGFRFDEMWDLDKLTSVGYSWGFDGKKWFLDVGKLPNSEKYLLTVKGKVGDEFLNQIVSVRAAENPCKVGELDKFWIHSALKDVDILRRLWSELNVERVNADVRIGVERIFTSAIPRAVKEFFELQKELLMSIKSGNRDLEQKLRFRYRKQTKTRLVSPSELFELLKGFVTGDFFGDFVSVSQPFVLNEIEALRDPTSIVPEKVKVGVLTDLDYKTPTAKGDLAFHRRKFEESVSKKIREGFSK